MSYVLYIIVLLLSCRLRRSEAVLIRWMREQVAVPWLVPACRQKWYIQSESACLRSNLTRTTPRLYRRLRLSVRSVLAMSQ